MDKAFWVTVIPAVILWNTVRAPLLYRMGQLFAIDETAALSSMLLGTLVFSCAVAAVAGYLAVLLSAPKHISAGVNVAVGVTIAFGLQNYIEHRHADVAALYFVALPIMSALAAVAGSILCALINSAVRSRREHSVRLKGGA